MRTFCCSNLGRGGRKQRGPEQATAELCTAAHWCSRVAGGPVHTCAALARPGTGRRVGGRPHLVVAHGVGALALAGALRGQRFVQRMQLGLLFGTRALVQAVLAATGSGERYQPRLPPCASATCLTTGQQSATFQSPERRRMAAFTQLPLQAAAQPACTLGAIVRSLQSSYQPQQAHLFQQPLEAADLVFERHGLFLLGLGACLPEHAAASARVAGVP